MLSFLAYTWDVYSSFTGYVYTLVLGGDPLGLSHKFNLNKMMSYF
jgi:hypothetical protein